MKSKAYQKRFYRDWISKQGLNSCEVIVEETDLLISSDLKIGIQEIKTEIDKYRGQIRDYIAVNNDFLTSLKPIEVDVFASQIVKDMAEAAKLAGVGPMAAVAGAIDQHLGEGIFKGCEDVIIENGGDIFIRTTKPRRIGVYAGDSPLSGKIAIEIEPKQSPCGVCCSSGTVGHSLSFGQADAVVVIAATATLADAVVTEACNRVKSKEKIAEALEFARKIPGVFGVLVIYGEHLGALGDIKLVELCTGIHKEIEGDSHADLNHR